MGRVCACIDGFEKDCVACMPKNCVDLLGPSVYYLDPSFVYRRYVLQLLCYKAGLIF
jgi:hypothetical protein